MKFDADDVAIATVIQSAIQKPEFVFLLGLIFMKTFLNLIAPADKILQSREISFRESMPIIQSVMFKVEECRKSSEYENILQQSEVLLKQTNIEEDVRPKRKITRSSWLQDSIITDCIGERSSDSSVELRSAYYSVIDIFSSEMKRRFETNKDILLAVSDAGEFCHEKLKPLEKLGIRLPSVKELSVAKNYIARQQQKYEEDHEGEKQSFKNRFKLLQEIYSMKKAFPDVYKLMAAVETFGSGTAICECAFSALDRIGSPKRINMNNDRLRNLTYLAFEKKRLKDISADKVLQKFNENPLRRIQLY